MKNRSVSANPEVPFAGWARWSAPTALMVKNALTRGLPANTIGSQDRITRLYPAAEEKTIAFVPSG